MQFGLLRLYHILLNKLQSDEAINIDSVPGCIKVRSTCITHLSNEAFDTIFLDIHASLYLEKNCKGPALFGS